jgi:hypothetical protein
VVSPKEMTENLKCKSKYLIKPNKRKCQNPGCYTVAEFQQVFDVQL